MQTILGSQQFSKTNWLWLSVVFRANLVQLGRGAKRREAIA